MIFIRRGTPFFCPHQPGHKGQVAFTERPGTHPFPRAGQIGVFNPPSRVNTPLPGAAMCVNLQYVSELKGQACKSVSGGGTVFYRKIKLFSWMGFEVGIDPSWVILAVLVAWSLSAGYFPYAVADLPTSTYWMMGIIGALGLFASIVFHELCHSVLARRSGLQIKGITLFIFGGVAEMGEEPRSARDELLIAGVGPLSSFFMAALFYIIANVGAAFQWPQPAIAVYNTPLFDTLKGAANEPFNQSYGIFIQNPAASRKDQQ